MSAVGVAPTVPSSRVPRLDSLTGLRFAAALAVFAHHITVLLPQTRFRHIESTLRVGPTGVSFFFVLSGFVLLWSRRPDDSSGAFLQRRIARIWPAHAATWIAGMVLVYATQQSLFAKSSVLNLLLLQAWVPQQTWYFSVNVVSWSLAIEWFFYLMFAFLLVPIARLTARAAARASVALALLFIVLEVALHTGLHAHPDLREYFVYIFPPTRLVEFLIPCTIILAGAENLFDRHRRPQGWLRPALAGLFGLVHGAGFATTLRDLFDGSVVLPLLSFNIGIELGQALVLTVMISMLTIADRLLRAPAGDANHALVWRIRMTSLAAAGVALVMAAERAPW